MMPNVPDEPDNAAPLVPAPTGHTTARTVSGELVSATSVATSISAAITEVPGCVRLAPGMTDFLSAGRRLFKHSRKPSGVDVLLTGNTAEVFLDCIFDPARSATETSAELTEVITRTVQLSGLHAGQVHIRVIGFERA